MLILKLVLLWLEFSNLFEKKISKLQRQYMLAMKLKNNFLLDIILSRYYKINNTVGTFSIHRKQNPLSSYHCKITKISIELN